MTLSESKEILCGRPKKKTKLININHYDCIILIKYPRVQYISKLLQGSINLSNLKRGDIFSKYNSICLKITKNTSRKSSIQFKLTQIKTPKNFKPKRSQGLHKRFFRIILRWTLLNFKVTLSYCLLPAIHKQGS